MAIFELINPQRYFHLVAIKSETDILKNESLLKELGFKIEKNYDEIDEIEILQLSIISNIPFYRGEQDFSVKGNNMAPFKYDSMLINLVKLKISILCLPFKLLTKVVIESLINNHKLLSKNTFVKVDLDKLIKSNDEHTDYVDNDISYFFSSVNLTLTEESALSSVKLDGDKPLDSMLYKSIFKEKILEGKCKLEKCILKSSTSISNKPNIPNTKSAMHVDKYGNYKFYMHSTGNNITTVPLVFEHINKMECLIETPINPVNNLKEDKE